MISKKQIIIGIDPGLGKCGWGIIATDNNAIHYVDSGTIKTSTKSCIAIRLLTLNEGLKKILDKYTPSVCSIEEVFVNNNPRSSLKLGHARGAIILTMSQFNLPIYEYTPATIKKSIVGTGRADKNQMIYMVKKLLPTSSAQGEDAHDALGTALCYFFKN